MLPNSRARLRAQEGHLLAALLDGDTPPDGFDPQRLLSAADALRRKRARSLARAWPGLAGALGSSFPTLFQEFSGTIPLSAGGSLADGREFARWLRKRRALPTEGRLEAMSFDLQHAQTAGVRAAMIRRPRRLLVGVRVPGLGVRWISIRLGR